MVTFALGFGLAASAATGATGATDLWGHTGTVTGPNGHGATRSGTVSRY